VRQVRDLGFSVGLHTSGSYPRRLARLLPALDWVGLDIKALPEDYAALTGVEDSGERAYRSLRLLLDSGVSHEVRVTVHERLLPPSKLLRLLELLRDSGVAKPVLQRCRSEAMLDPSLGSNRQSGLSEERCTTAQWQAAASDRHREDILRA
jgi:pyruvate formate lyase activating enzyme